MKKIRSTAIILFLLAAVSLIALQERFWTDSPEKLLVNAFQSSGAKIVSSEIYFRGKIDRAGSSNLQGLGEIASKLAKVLDCTENGLAKKTINNEDLEGVEINGTSGKNLSIAISAVMSKSELQPKNCYITASVVDKAGAQDMVELRSRVVSMLGRYGIFNPSVNSCMTGSYEGKLDNNNLNDICVKIFKSADARKVEGISENNLISVSAYTPSIGQAVEVNGRRVNLNLAVRFNSYEKKTYIWLATPVITTEY